jgi:hypothetical protein
MSVDDFDRLKDKAGNLSAFLQVEADHNPQDALIILAMVSSFLLDTQRVDGTSVQKARETFFKIVTIITDAAKDKDLH